MYKHNKQNANLSNNEPFGIVRIMLYGKENEMATAKLTSKGQITIPAQIRQYLHLNTGDKIEFIINPDGKVYVIPANIDITELEGILPKPKKTIRLTEMDIAIRNRSVKKCME